MAGPTWNNPIRGYFTPTDVQHMKQVAGFDLSNYNDVVKNAEDIYAQVSAGNMPPGSPWPQDWVDNFGTWAQNGFPES
jgi:tyrosinase